MIVAACARPQPPVMPVAPAPAAAFADRAVADDPLQLAAHAERLCTPLADADQRALGFRLAARGRALTPDDRGLSRLVARCAYLAADLAADDEQVRALAAAGIDAATHADPDGHDPQLSYYRGVCLGLSIRSAGIGAVGKLPELVATLTVAGREPAVDLGGPLRVLGMLYLRAPPWPAGPGDLEAALDLLRRARARFPSHPLNHLFLAYALKEDGDQQGAAAELEAALPLLSSALWGKSYAERWSAEISALEAALAP